MIGSDLNSGKPFNQIIIVQFVFFMSRCGDTGDKAHTVSYCPTKLRARRLSSEGGAREEDTDPRIPTPMVGHLINRMMLERAGERDLP